MLFILMLKMSQSSEPRADFQTGVCISCFFSASIENSLKKASEQKWTDMYQYAVCSVGTGGHLTAELCPTAAARTVLQQLQRLI